MKTWILLIAALLVAACGGEPVDPPTPDVDTIRATQHGPIIGFTAENGAHVWRGVPFAASTAGENRWRAPKPPQGWSETREALQFAERCAQLTNMYDAGEGLKPGRAVGSEDCLAVNIFAPPDAEGADLPVMVWIHGGGNVWGRSGDYDGSRLAQNENVIIVAVQYRLGPFGWFAHEALRESAADPRDAAASFAVLDLIASLEWVRDNITAFGGDADNVT
ncbi:MAG: carboxylesterase family protein, partial [Pseudomonadota bacterium]